MSRTPGGRDKNNYPNTPSRWFGGLFSGKKEEPPPPNHDHDDEDGGDTTMMMANGGDHNNRTTPPRSIVGGGMMRFPTTATTTTPYRRSIMPPRDFSSSGGAAAAAATTNHSANKRRRWEEEEEKESNNNGNGGDLLLMNGYPNPPRPNEEDQDGVRPTKRARRATAASPWQSRETNRRSTATVRFQDDFNRMARIGEKQEEEEEKEEGGEEEPLLDLGLPPPRRSEVVLHSRRFSQQPNRRKTYNFLDQQRFPRQSLNGRRSSVGGGRSHLFRTSLPMSTSSGVSKKFQSTEELQHALLGYANSQHGQQQQQQRPRTSRPPRRRTTFSRGPSIQMRSRGTGVGTTSTGGVGDNHPSRRLTAWQQQQQQQPQQEENRVVRKKKRMESGVTFADTGPATSENRGDDDAAGGQDEGSYPALRGTGLDEEPESTFETVGTDYLQSIVPTTMDDHEDDGDSLQQLPPPPLIHFQARNTTTTSTATTTTPRVTDNLPRRAANEFVINAEDRARDDENIQQLRAHNEKMKPKWETEDPDADDVAPSSGNAVTGTWGNLFQDQNEMWKCPSCLMWHSADKLKCASCQTSRDGGGGAGAAPASNQAPAPGSIGAGGFTFAPAAAAAAATTSPAPATSAASTNATGFGGFASSVTAATGQSNSGDVSAPVAGGFATATTSTTTDGAAPLATSGGFMFNASSAPPSGGFSFVTTTTNDAPSSNANPPAGGFSLTSDNSSKPQGSGDGGPTTATSTSLKEAPTSFPKQALSLGVPAASGASDNGKKEETKEAPALSFNPTSNPDTTSEATNAGAIAQSTGGGVSFPQSTTTTKVSFSDTMNGNGNSGSVRSASPSILPENTPAPAVTFATAPAASAPAPATAASEPSKTPAPPFVFGKTNPPAADAPQDSGQAIPNGDQPAVLSFPTAPASTAEPVTTPAPFSLTVPSGTPAVGSAGASTSFGGSSSAALSSFGGPNSSAPFSASSSTAGTSGTPSFGGVSASQTPAPAVPSFGAGSGQTTAAPSLGGSTNAAPPPAQSFGFNQPTTAPGPAGASSMFPPFGQTPAPAAPAATPQFGQPQGFAQQAPAVPGFGTSLPSAGASGTFAIAANSNAAPAAPTNFGSNVASAPANPGFPSTSFGTTLNTAASFGMPSQPSGPGGFGPNSSVGAFGNNPAAPMGGPVASSYASGSAVGAGFQIGTASEKPRTQRGRKILRAKRPNRQA